MSRTPRLAAVAAASAAAVALTASPALAWTGGAVSASTGPVGSCANVVLNGSVTPAGALTVAAVSFISCTPQPVPQSLPWAGSITDGGGAATLGVRVSVPTPGGPCTYGGTLTGTNTAAPAPVTISFPVQTINKVAGSFLCPNTIQTSLAQLVLTGPGI